MRLIAPVPCRTSNYLLSLGLIADWLQVGHLRVRGSHTVCSFSPLLLQSSFPGEFGQGSPLFTPSAFGSSSVSTTLYSGHILDPML